MGSNGRSPARVAALLVALAVWLAGCSSTQVETGGGVLTVPADTVPLDQASVARLQPDTGGLTWANDLSADHVPVLAIGSGLVVAVGVTNEPAGQLGCGRQTNPVIGAFDLVSGQGRWRRAVSQPAPSTPPLAVVGGMVVTQRSEATTTVVVGLDPATGNERWHTDGLYLGAGAGTVLAAVGAQPPRLVGLDPADGSPRWELELGPVPAGPTPVPVSRRATGPTFVSPGLIRAGATADAFVTISPLGLIVLDAATGTDRWQRDQVDTAVADPGGSLIAVQQGSQVAALDPASGAERWQAELPDGLKVAAAGPDGVFVVRSHFLPGCP